MTIVNQQILKIMIKTKSAIDNSELSENIVDRNWLETDLSSVSVRQIIIYHQYYPEGSQRLFLGGASCREHFLLN